MRARERGSEAGFTLAELLVVAVVGIIILTGVIRILVSTQQVYTAQTARMESQQLVRAGLALLAGELREVSPAGGDLLEMQPNLVRMRVMRSVGLACEVEMTNPPRVTATRLGPDFAAGDSIFLFAENNPNRSDDDVWLRGVVGTVDVSVTCPSGTPAQRLTLPGMSAPMTANIVRPGALLRSFEHVSYGLYQRTEGDWFLGQRRGAGTGLSGGAWEPLLGPLRPGDGNAPLFRYLNASGAVTTVPTGVEQIQVTVRTQGRARGPDGNLIQDTLTIRVQTRN